MPVCGIVLPQFPTPRERFAAEELIGYIKKISGATLEVSDRYENRIIIGEPERNSVSEVVMTQSEFEALVPGPEGFKIRCCWPEAVKTGWNRNGERCMLCMNFWSGF